MQGRENQVTGLRGLDSDLGCFQVTNLTDHDHIRILAEKRTQSAGKGHPLLGILLYLVDAGNPDFNWIFNSRNITAFVIQNIQGGIQCDRFTTTCRSCN